MLGANSVKTNDLLFPEKPSEVATGIFQKTKPPREA